jgi:hypothetical protein
MRKVTLPVVGVAVDVNDATASSGSVSWTCVDSQ